MRTQCPCPLGHPCQAPCWHRDRASPGGCQALGWGLGCLDPAWHPPAICPCPAQHTRSSRSGRDGPGRGPLTRGGPLGGGGASLRGDVGSQPDAPTGALGSQCEQRPLVSPQGRSNTSPLLLKATGIGVGCQASAGHWDKTPPPWWLSGPVHPWAQLCVRSNHEKPQASCRREGPVTPLERSPQATVPSVTTVQQQPEATQPSTLPGLSSPHPCWVRPPLPGAALRPSCPAVSRGVKTTGQFVTNPESAATQEAL